MEENLKESLKERYEKKLEEMLEKAGVLPEGKQKENKASDDKTVEEKITEDGILTEGEEEETESAEQMDSKLDDIWKQLDPKIQRALDDMGFEKLTPIQEQAIPTLLSGKDIIGQAQTGTGKTAAFGIPLVSRVDPKLQKLQAIVLCPTRELAMQAAQELRKLAKYIEGLRVLPVYGGQDITKQIRSLPGVQIVVGTPGRVMDHMNRHTIKLDDVSMVVLDEADEMLNMGFREDMEVILGAIPNEHQTALFSATMPKPILEITGKFQKDAVNIKVIADELTIPLISQKYFMVKSRDKDAATVRLLEYYQPKLCLIFCNTKMKVEELAEVLKKNDFQAEGLHGDLVQHQRDIVMGRFRNGSTNILIATDVAARGIDVDDVEIVINYDIPKDNEYYVHRIGRTGRAGRTGQSFTFVGAKELYRIRDIERYCKTQIEEKKLPDPSKVLKSKAKKYLDMAWELREFEEDIELMKVYLRRKMEKDGCDIFDLAACMLRQEIGEKGEEIPEDKPQPKNNRGDRKFGRRGEEGRGERKFGKRDEEGRSERKFGNRDEEGRGERKFGNRDEEGRSEKKFGKHDEEGRGERKLGKHVEEGRDDKKFRGHDEEGRDNRKFESHDEEGIYEFWKKDAGKRQKKAEPREERIFGRKYERISTQHAYFESKETKNGDKPAKKRDSADAWDKPKKRDKAEKWDKPGAAQKHQDKKERKTGLKSGKRDKIDAKLVKDVDQYGRPRKVKKDRK